MKFGVGQKVWVAHAPDGIMPGTHAGVILGPWLPGGDKAYLIKLEGFSHSWWSEEKYISPRDEPPAKREELGSWDLCPWQPKQVNA